MSEGLTDIGGLAILRVVQGQDESWSSKTNSNHTLQSFQITERAGISMSETVLTKLQSAFVSSHGGLDSLFSLLRSRNNSPERFTNHPTPERIRLMKKMEKVSNENKVLKALLKSERCHRSQRHLRDSTKDFNVRHLEEDEQRERNTFARCLLLPLFKLCETCKFLIELLYTK